MFLEGPPIVAVEDYKVGHPGRGPHETVAAHGKDEQRRLEE